MIKPEIQPENARTLIEHAIAHLDHVLPAQAPLQDFVHHNTLHGFQHLPFTQALAKAEKLTGIRAYLPEAQYRQYFSQGRINDDDLHAALAAFPELAGEELVCLAGETSVLRKHIYRIAMLYDLAPVSLAELNWQIEELATLDKIQPDVPEAIAKNFLEATTGGVNLSPNPVRQLWQALCEGLELMPASFHPEQLLDADLIRAEAWVQKNQETVSAHAETRRLSQNELHDFFARIGVNLSLRDVILALTGKDILATIRPQMIRLCGSLLDEGVAAWRLPERSQLGLYGAWRNLSRFDLFPFLNEFSDYSRIIADLPHDPVDCISQQLGYFAIPPDRWQGYLERLALEIPGWAGMVNWRQQHPNYAADKTHPQLADFLAIRLVMDRLWLNQFCREIWKIEGKARALQAYFEKNLSEFMVRRELHAGRLPEYLTHEAEMLVVRAGSERECRQAWQHLADLIAIWQKKTATDMVGGLSVNNSGWRLFRLCQHLGLTGNQVEAIGKAGLLTMLNILEAFDLSTRSKLWLAAYERHYREELFIALQANFRRGIKPNSYGQPQAQVITCMDEREESFRRQLEEINPTIETFGAAGFFGVAMYYKKFGGVYSVPLCPVVVTPLHRVDEVAQPDQETKVESYRKEVKVNKIIKAFIFHDLRLRTLLAYLGVNLLAPFVFAGLLLKTFIPDFLAGLTKLFSRHPASKVTTALAINYTGDNVSSDTGAAKLGFTDEEQAQTVANLLKVIGLTSNFAPIVLLVGHGSTSVNNPHEAAHDCGACGGRQGGPNARAFAAMANRPEVRSLLTGQNLDIPSDTWFIGAQHDTCSDAISYFDLDRVPSSSQAALERLQSNMRKAQALSAHERSRRFDSASHLDTPEEFFKHVTLRADDYSQVRPEYGHATNAAVIIGKRAITQGLFLDRRVFLISYNAEKDDDGSILESILLTAGPVGAGISLEYYFSTVNNERFGCSTKLPHNLTGLFGVMEGTSSDLRTGLPLQMVEIHEPMRLLIVVEAKNSILAEIYGRQPALRELISGGWVQLASKDPATNKLYLFEPDSGFVHWQESAGEIREINNSIDYYAGKQGPVAPAIVKHCGAVAG